jgi:DNA-binding response OmpR family regulator
MATKPHVLLVDGCEPGSRTICSRLRDEGFAVTECASSLAALTEIEQGAPADVLVTEIRLPPGQPHGLALAAMAYLRRPALKIMFLTACPELVARHVGGEHGTLVRKPVTPGEFVREVRHQLSV